METICAPNSGRDVAVRPGHLPPFQWEEFSSYTRLTPALVRLTWITIKSHRWVAERRRRLASYASGWQRSWRFHVLKGRGRVIARPCPRPSRTNDFQAHTQTLACLANLRCRSATTGRHLLENSQPWRPPVRRHLLRLAQSGDGARPPGHFTVAECEVSKFLEPPDWQMLKRRERRAPLQAIRCLPHWRNSTRCRRAKKLTLPRCGWGTICGPSRF